MSVKKMRFTLNNTNRKLNIVKRAFFVNGFGLLTIETALNLKGKKKRKKEEKVTTE